MNSLVKENQDILETINEQNSEALNVFHFDVKPEKTKKNNNKRKSKDESSMKAVEINRKSLSKDKKKVDLMEQLQIEYFSDNKKSSKGTFNRKFTKRGRRLFAAAARDFERRKTKEAANVSLTRQTVNNLSTLERWHEATPKEVDDASISKGGFINRKASRLSTEEARSRSRSKQSKGSRSKNQTLSVVVQSKMVDLDLLSEDTSSYNQGPYRKNELSTLGTVFSEDADTATLNSRERETEPSSTMQRFQNSSVFYNSTRKARKSFVAVHKNRFLTGGKILINKLFKF